MTTTQRANLLRLIAALRSGEYKQCQSRLRIERADGSVEHCCMGVGCDLMDPKGWKHAGKLRIDLGTGEFAIPYYSPGEEERLGVPGLSVSDYYGLRAEGIVPGHWHLLNEADLRTTGHERGMTLYAATANDDLRLTFSQIADCLEWEYTYQEVGA